MIAPRGRLIWLFGLVAWPALTLLALVPELAPVCLFVVGVVAIVAVTDAVLSRDRLRNVRIVAPELVRFSKGRKGSLELRVANDNRTRPLPLRLAIALPADFTIEMEELRLNVPPQAAVVASIECTPAQRGRFALENAALQTPSMLGLWNIRSNVAVSTELRVYPDLLAERQHVAAMFLHRGAVGARPIRRVGKGRDFEQLRDYISGDSAEDVHWKATAKRGRPVTKVFQVEQTQEVYVIIDASRLSARVASGAPMLDHFVNAALVLCLAAGQRSDLFGLATFSDKVQSFVRAKNGKAHYNLCRDTLYRLQPERVTPDFDDLFTFLRLRLRRRALLVFLTALDDPALAAGFVDKIDLLARQHLVLVNMPRPGEANPLFAGDQVGDVTQLYRRLGGHLVWHDLRELGTRLHRHGVRLSLVDHASLTPDVIAQYLQVKQRQLI